VKPEDNARQIIDQTFESAGWIVQNFKAINLSAGAGVAVDDYPSDKEAYTKDMGRPQADYLLFVEREPVGMIEAKRDEKGENPTELYNDEPAGMLLKRIRAMRGDTGRRRTRKAKEAT
jgi:type I restriction enzyme R subunit